MTWDYKTTRIFWDNQAKEFGENPEATTKDFYLREIEIKCLKEAILKYCGKKDKIADIGCGNGYSTIKLSKFFPELNFSGFDYSEIMIKFAKKNLNSNPINNLTFNVCDIINNPLSEKFDLIYTDRCLINLPDYNSQKAAINKIHNHLSENGYYIMIENFIEGHNNFNDLRKEFGLDEIDINEHNQYFNSKKLLPFLEEKFDIIKNENISSMYYMVSRIIYSKTCIMQNKKPDYYNIHHELGSQLPFSGNYGPISMLHLKKKSR